MRTEQSLKNILMSLYSIQAHLETLQKMSFKKRYDDNADRERFMYQLATLNMLSHMEKVIKAIEESPQQLGEWMWDAIERIAFDADMCTIKDGIRYMLYSGVLAQCHALCNMHDIIRGED